MGIMEAYLNLPKNRNSIVKFSYLDKKRLVYLITFQKIILKNNYRKNGERR